MAPRPNKNDDNSRVVPDASPMPTAKPTITITHTSRITIPATRR